MIKPTPAQIEAAANECWELSPLKLGMTLHEIPAVNRSQEPEAKRVKLAYNSLLRDDNEANRKEFLASLLAWRDSLTRRLGEAGEVRSARRLFGRKQK